MGGAQEKTRFKSRKALSMFQSALQPPLCHLFLDSVLVLVSTDKPTNTAAGIK